jgi:hypothetical protein
MSEEDDWKREPETEKAGPMLKSLKTCPHRPQGEQRKVEERRIVNRGKASRVEIRVLAGKRNQEKRGQKKKVRGRKDAKENPKMRDLLLLQKTETDLSLTAQNSGVLAQAEGEVLQAMNSETDSQTEGVVQIWTGVEDEIAVNETDVIGTDLFRNVKGLALSETGLGTEVEIVWVVTEVEIV